MYSCKEQCSTKFLVGTFYHCHEQLNDVRDKVFLGRLVVINGAGQVEFQTTHLAPCRNMRGGLRDLSEVWKEYWFRREAEGLIFSHFKSAAYLGNLEDLWSHREGMNLGASFTRSHRKEERCPLGKLEEGQLV